MKINKQTKTKHQNGHTQENGIDENNGHSESSASLKLTDADREKGDFENFEISTETVEKLKARNVQCLFPVQAESYTHIYNGKDCIVQAYTGTGKTLGFAIPIVEALQNDSSAKLTRGRQPRALVLAPTRELTKQISDDFESVVTGISIVTIYGGKRYEDQENSIRQGCDVLVATPGRLKDILEKKKVSLAQVKHVILDEVDRMLDMGFIDDVEQILGHIFKGDQQKKAQFVVFSATMPDWVHKTTRKYMTKDFVTVDLVQGNTQRTSANVEHLAVSCAYHERAVVINGLVQVYSSTTLDGRAIVFCETKKEADELSVSHDIKAEAHVLHGDIPQDKRELVLKKFREGKYRLLITTDVAARGLDIPEVDLVIVTAPPKDVESYIHRSGRTGRAGAQGKCICLYKYNQIRDLKRVEMEAGIEFKRIEAPGTAALVSASSADALRALDTVTEKAIAHFRPTAQKILENRDPADALAAALACITGTTDIVPRSLLTKKENHTTYMLTVTDEMKGPGLVFTLLRRCFGEDFDATGKCSRVAFTEDYKSAVFDFPSELDEKLQSYWKDSPRMQLKAIDELPELADQQMNGSRGFSRNGYGNSRRNGPGAGRSNFSSKFSDQNGQRKGRENGGPRSGGNGCFNCGQEGHKSFECSEPKKDRSSSNFGGRGVKRTFAGNRSNGTNETNSNKKIKFGDDD